ncbi:MAG: SnoaL-like domain-containing protein, partial [Bacteroidota bacterium]
GIHMSYREKAQAMQEQMGQGQIMEAFEKYYAENCQITEKPTGEVRDGKAAQRAAIQQWFGMVKEFHGGGVNSITSDEEAGVTMVESWSEITFQDGKRVKMEEVAVQKWEGDQIAAESFYYHMPMQPQNGN